MDLFKKFPHSIWLIWHIECRHWAALGMHHIVSIWSYRYNMHPQFSPILMLKASPNRIWGLLWVVSWRSCLGSSWGKSNKGQNMLISPFYHSFIHLNMNTIALNAESRLILMDEIVYDLKSSIVYSSSLLHKWMPASFFLSCFGLFCHTDRSIGPWVKTRYW